MRLQGKIAIVTGAGQTAGEGTGNGRATAIMFAREGAKLVLANRSEASLKETRAQIEQEGYKAQCITADVSNEADCVALVKTTVDQFGRVDILHNNVGFGTLEGDTTAIELESWKNILDINVTSAMLLSKHVLPVMRAQKAGCITHVSSTAAIMSLPLIAYKTAKMALNEFTRWLAFENAPYNIRCNVLMLGLIDTPVGIENAHAFTGRPREEVRKERDQTVPMGRMGTPWETAKVATFLASDESSYITGAVIPMDGGLHTRVG